MKISVIKDSISDAWNKASFTAQKHAPTILIVGGVIGAVTAGVMACVATTKVNDILDESKTQLDAIHDAQARLENGEALTCSDGSEYTPENVNKDTAIVYAHTAVKLVKLYGPSVALGAASLLMIGGSHHIMTKRNAALAAAYATIDTSFKNYRGNVIERFGEHVDKELRYGLKAKEIETTTVDENGEVKTEKVTVYEPGDPTNISGYARYFEKYSRDSEGGVIPNPNWQDTPEYNLMFLKRMERYANDILRSRKRLFLNEVYAMLGIPISKEGQIVGWVYDPSNPDIDNYVDFGLYNEGPQKYSDFLYGNDEGILLDFNVDGNIWDLM